MKRIIEDNTVSVVQKAISYFQVPVTKETIRDSLKMHPYYPTFKSICDVLTDWKIEQYPLHLNIDEIKDINTPYIAHIKDNGGQIVFVTKIKNDTVHYYDSFKTKKTIVLNEFLEKCSGAVILINSNENSGEKDYRIKRQNEILNNSILLATIGTIAIFAALTFFRAVFQGSLFLNISVYLLFSTKILGTILSILLVLYELDIYNPISEKLCHLDKTTNCNTILNARASKIFGWFGWADLGFIYFVGSVLFMLQNLKSTDYGLTAIVSVMALPYPIFSIYYQGFLLKKWCPLCLGVQVVLIAEFLLLLPQFSRLHISINGINCFISTFLVLGTGYLLGKGYFIQKEAIRVTRHNYLEFKMNPEVFNALLLKNKFHHIPTTDNSLVFGPKNELLTITAFLSLHCDPCAKAFEKIKTLLINNNGIKINIVFAIHEDNIAQKAIQALYYIQHQFGENEALLFLENWYSSSPISQKLLLDKYSASEDLSIIEEINKINYKLFDECKITSSPTFLVNGYSLPKQYDLKDVKYFANTIKTTFPILVENVN